MRSRCLYKIDHRDEIHLLMEEPRPNGERTAFPKSCARGAKSIGIRSSVSAVMATSGEGTEIPAMEQTRRAP